MKLIDREPTEEMLFAARFYKEGTHTLACAWRAMYDAAPDIQQEPIGYIDGHYGFVRTKEGINLPIGAKAYAFPPDAQAEITRLNDLVEEQKGTITALNMALGGEDSTSTENLIDAHEADFTDEGLIALCRDLTKENVRLEDVVLFQKKAWASDLEELEKLKYQIASSESRSITEEVEDILRSEITKRDARIKALEQAIDNEMVVSHLGVFNPGDDPKVALNKLQCYAEDLGSFFAQDQLNLQAAEIARLKDALLRITKVEADTVTTAYDMRRIAIAAIKEIEK